jgi:hypothetical protein
MSKPALAKLLSDHKAELAKLKAQLEKQKREHKTKMDTERLACVAKVGAVDGKLQICKDTNKVSRSIYDSAMKRTVKSCQRSWYEHPLIVFGAGVAVCGASVGIGSAVR